MELIEIFQNNSGLVFAALPLLGGTACRGGRRADSGCGADCGARLAAVCRPALYADPETGEVLDYGAAGDWAVVTGEDGPWYQVQYNLQTGYMAQEGLELHQAENIEL